MKKRSVATVLIVLAVIILSVFILTSSKPNVPEETAKCIGENAVLYTQLGCHACEYQEKLFGSNYQHLNVIDCWFEQEKCLGIKGTPTWIINEKEYLGAKSIEQLKELTGC